MTLVTLFFTAHQVLFAVAVAAGFNVGILYFLWLGIFNLIPLPPLDGSKIIESFLPLKLARQYETIAKYSFFILIALMLTSVGQRLLYTWMAPALFAEAVAQGVMGSFALPSRFLGG